MVKNLLRNLNVLNLLLLIVTVGFAVNSLVPLIDSPVGYTAPRVKAVPLKSAEETVSPGPTVNPLDYTVIAEQNLFHPERKIPPEKKAEAPLPKPEFVLYGTLITSDLGIAYLEDKKAAPVTTPGRGKRQTALKKGESMSGFVLKEIQADRVTMTRGEETLVVNLNDSQNPKAREGADTAKVGGIPSRGPTAATKPTSPTSPTTPTAPVRPAPSPGTVGTRGEAVNARPGTASGSPTVSPGGVVGPTSGGTFTPTRPRYRPLPPTPSVGPSGPYPAPSSGSGQPYP